MSRVSLASVAAALDISTMTVSRALRGQPGVSAELRHRIADTARRLGYRPDPEIGRLMHYLRRGEKAGLRASLCGLTDWPKETEPLYSARLYRNAGDHARALGFAFSVVRIDPKRGGLTAILRNLRARGVQGIVLLPLVVPTALPAEGWEDFSVVSATSSVTAPHIHDRSQPRRQRPPLRRPPRRRPPRRRPLRAGRLLPAPRPQPAQLPARCPRPPAGHDHRRRPAPLAACALATAGNSRIVVAVATVTPARTCYRRVCSVPSRGHQGRRLLLG